MGRRRTESTIEKIGKEGTGEHKGTWLTTEYIENGERKKTNEESMKTIQRIIKENNKEYEKERKNWSAKENVKDICRKGTKTVIIRDNKNGICGAMVTREEEEREKTILYIYELQLTERIRNRGIGTTLMEMAKKRQWLVDSTQ